MQSEISKLWKHQQDAIDRAGNEFALFFQPGCGKSRTTIEILRKIYTEHKQIIPTLILCPPVVISNWRKEIEMYSKINLDSVHKLVGTGKQRLEILKPIVNGIVITNYETLNMPDVFEELMLFMSRGPSILVLDESHRCKDPTAKRTKRAIELADRANYRYLLTGTPILNNLMDIFSQFRILDKGARFGKNFFTFRARYFEDKNRAMPASKYFPKWDLIPGSDRKIKELMEPVSMFVEKDTCLSLPPLVKKVIEVPMSKEQARLYNEMRKDLVATINDNGVDKHSIAELAITKALRLQQVVSGHLKVEGADGESEVIKIKDNPRKEALKQLLEDLAPNHKILVWAVFHANYEDIKEVCDDLDIGYSQINGLVKDKDAEAHRFRTDPKCRVLIGHPASGGLGLNLIEASYMIYYSRSFSLEYDVQSEARNYRGGSECHQKITRIDLVTPGTIDELVLKSLASKQALSNSVLRDKLMEI